MLGTPKGNVSFNSALKSNLIHINKHQTQGFQCAVFIKIALASFQLPFVGQEASPRENKWKLVGIVMCAASSSVGGCREGLSVMFPQGLCLSPFLTPSGLSICLVLITTVGPHPPSSVVSVSQ